MDAHDKGAVLIACGLPTKLRGLLQLMLFTLAPIGAAEFTASNAAIAAAAGVSESTVYRYLRRLEALGFIVITNNGAIGRRGCLPQQRPNSYRMLTNTERAAAETELIVCQIDRLDSPVERKIPSVGTGASTEAAAARAKWLPELPGGQEGSLPTNTHPDQCVEILAPSEPIGADPAPMGSRLGGIGGRWEGLGFLPISPTPSVPSDNHGHRTEPRMISPDAGRMPDDSPGQPDGHRTDINRQNVRNVSGSREQKERTEPMARWNHPVCDPCSMPLRGTHVLIRGAPGGRVQFCGWCANRTESGLVVRCDPADVPYPDNPADARHYLAKFRAYGVTAVTGPRGLPIRLDRMGDPDAVYAAGQIRLIIRSVTRQRAAGLPPVRRLGLS